MMDNLLSSCGNASNFTKSTGVYFGNRIGCRSFQKASMSLRGREPYNNCHMVHGYFIYDITWRSCSSNPLVGPSKNYHASSSPCYSDRSVPDMTLNGLSCDEQLATSTLSADQYVILPRVGLLYVYFNHYYKWSPRIFFFHDGLVTICMCSCNNWKLTSTPSM